MRLILILIIFFFQINAQSKEFWKTIKGIEHENYYENVGVGIKKVLINGKKKKLKFTAREFFPKSTKTTKKEGLCKKWRIQEVSLDEKYVWKKYALNDCMPCIDKGSGYICSYPYFEVNYRSELFGKYWDSNFSYLTEVEDLIDDGTKEISMAINLGNREQIVLSNRQLKLTDSTASFFWSHIRKYNTKLRKIVSERSKSKPVPLYSSFRLVFNRLSENINQLIKNKGELKLREKDLKILFLVEPSATITKFQTRD